MTYKVQINMSEDKEYYRWEDCDDCLFASVAEALNHIDWMLGEYGDTIEYRIVEVKK